ncbi:MAG: hypothetical protein WCA20_13640, partial [Candidatus Sulfotelmatobacter sp.]
MRWLKWRVGVLEAHEPPESTPRILCGRSIAEILVREHDAERVGERLIRMVRGNAVGAIRRARELRKQEKSTAPPRLSRQPFLFCASCHRRMIFPS